MHNHNYSNGQHQFLIHGGDRRSTNRLKWVAIGQLPFLLAVYVFAPEAITVGVLAYLVSLVVWFWWMGSGQSERYLVQIDLEKKSIMTEDRLAKQELWMDDFNPEWVRLSEIQVILNGEAYRHPALVYSDKELDLIMDAVPDSTRILLGIGELDEVQQVLSQLQSNSST